MEGVPDMPRRSRGVLGAWMVLAINLGAGLGYLIGVWTLPAEVEVEVPRHETLHEACARVCDAPPKRFTVGRHGYECECITTVEDVMF